jgi:hypothetical protein
MNTDKKTDKKNKILPNGRRVSPAAGYDFSQS